MVLGKHEATASKLVQWRSPRSFIIIFQSHIAECPKLIRSMYCFL
jgi:hypothetical protein